MTVQVAKSSKRRLETMPMKHLPFQTFLRRFCYLVSTVTTAKIIDLALLHVRA